MVNKADLEKIFNNTQPSKEITGANTVEITDATPGLDLRFESTVDALGDPVTRLEVDTNPAFESNRRSYQREATAQYNRKGELTVVTTDAFFGRDIDEATDAMGRELTDDQAGMLKASAARGTLVSMTEGDDAFKHIAAAWERGEHKYRTQTEEPHVRFTRSKDGSWNASLLPIPKKLIPRRHQLGKIHPDNDESVGVTWKGKNLVYQLRTTKTNDIPQLEVVTTLEDSLAINIGSGFTTGVHHERTLAVPSRLPPNKLENLFKPKDTSHLDMSKWFPVCLKKPI